MHQETGGSRTFLAQREARLAMKQDVKKEAILQKPIFSEQGEALARLIEKRSAQVGIIGMGYVGLPLAVATYNSGYPVIGFDVVPQKVEELNSGKSPIGRISDEELVAMGKSGRFEVTGDFSRLAQCDLVIICVPTPLSKHHEPDLSYVINSTKVIARHLRKGQLISLESTTYPGTTNEIMKPILEESGLVSGQDFFMAYSPEREDPGNKSFHTASIPKVVGGDGADATEIATRFYGEVVSSVVSVSSCDTAEAVKLTENIFRSVNIALVNELKGIYQEMGIDVWEVIDAAATKPFGYMPFYPGPGLGGHCIPIDPFYLTWKAREYEIPTRFIELAGQINTHQPRRVIEKLIDGLSKKRQKSLAGAHILLIGMAYKKNVEDVRESPAFSLIDLIVEKGGTVDYYDPWVPVIPPTREHGELTGKKSIDWKPEEFSAYDAALICTDHDGIDWQALVDAVPLVVDTRNALAKVNDRSGVVVKA